MTDNKHPQIPRMSLDPGRSLILFICIWALGFIIGSFISGFIMYKWADQAPAMRIASVLQDIFLFIIPAMVTALMVTRLPADFLGVNRRPVGRGLLYAVCTLVIAMPVINEVIVLNELMPMPENIEQWMRTTQEHANKSVEIILGGANIGSLIISLLLVGIMAAVSEELLFRGCLQRLLIGCRINHHLAIFLAAAVFSAIHMQFYGFFPRLFLGMLFGYMFYWSGSLWLSITLHAFNNILYVIGRWTLLQEGTVLPQDPASALQPWYIVLISLILTIAALAITRRTLLTRRQQTIPPDPTQH